MTNSMKGIKKPQALIHEQADQTYPLHTASAAEGKYYYQISS
jgi:hypothetical protein